jgi:hypothetical protein
VTAWCTNCADEFGPVEFNPAPVDPDEPRFCSVECEEAFNAALEAEEAYWSAGAPAPVW